MTIHADMYMMEDMLVALIPALTSGIPAMLLNIAAYVLTSMALYTLAVRRGIEKAWLSWVPVLNVWIIGSLSDQYRYVVKGQYKSKRKVLLGLNLANAVLTVILLVTAGGIIAELLRGAAYGALGSRLWNSLLGSVLGAAGLMLPMAAIGIAAAVIRYMALYDIYTSMDPANNVLYLVLSILFQVTEPFFLFFNRNRDGGMPPRREEPRQSVYEAWTEGKDYL